MYNPLKFLECTLPPEMRRRLRQEDERRRRQQEALYHPLIMQLEDRCLLTNCGSEPWCFDNPDFSGDGHAEVAIMNRAEARATAIQVVGTEQRIRAAGWADTNANLDEYKFAIARLCPAGDLDDSSSSCGGPGFGPTHNGVVVVDFYADTEFEGINAIAIQPNQHSDRCDTPGDPNSKSDKILAAGRVPVEISTVHHIIGVAHYCADGRLDVNWGGQTPDWYNLVPPYSDPAGMFTIGFNTNDSHLGWSRFAEPFAIAVEPTNFNVVVGGYVLLPKAGQDPDTATLYSFFGMARLKADGTGYDVFGPNDSSDHDHGRIRFDGDGDQDADHQMDEIRGLQLVPDQTPSNGFDIVIAGPDIVEDGTHRNFLVARVNYNGGTASNPWDDAMGGWNAPTFVTFLDGSTHRDDMAMDLVYRPAPINDVVVAGVTCVTTAPLTCVDETHTTPSSKFALARLNAETGAEELKRMDAYAARTNVAYSVVLQQLSTQTEPFIVIGGYSVETDGGIPYMAGSRFGPPLLMIGALRRCQLSSLIRQKSCPTASHQLRQSTKLRLTRFSLCPWNRDWRHRGTNVISSERFWFEGP